MKDLRELYGKEITYAAVKRGAEQAKEERGKYIGSFAQYADMEIDN